MTGSWATATLVAATVANGLMAGLFAAYSYAVMPGLGKAGDRTFVEAMQRTNAAILNGWFGICFAGALLFAVAAAALHLGRPPLLWIVTGLVLYAAVLVVTFVVNVPLNDQLAAAGDPAGIVDLAAVRQRFELTWVRWNVVRAVLSSLAFVSLTWALVLHGRVAT
jgi:uncharacterized membrane protein